MDVRMHSSHWRLFRSHRDQADIPLQSMLGVSLVVSVSVSRPRFCPTYASEIEPKEIRGRITGLFQIVVVIGVAFSYWVSHSNPYIRMYLYLS